MANYKDAGAIQKVLKKMYEETQVEWRISDFSIKAENVDLAFHYESPKFFINDICCFLRLYPTSGTNNAFMRMYISTNVLQVHSSEYHISLKKLDGSVEQLLSGCLEKNKKDARVCDMGNIIKRSELLLRMSELAPQNALTIICTLKREIKHSTEPSDKIMPLKLIST